MAAEVFGRVPRVALLAGIVLLGTATLTFAATSTAPPASSPPTEPAVQPRIIVVPDVRRQAYVFAKGTLEQAGFAWRVEGAVKGYAANVVLGQVPAAGTKVLGKGSPTVVLRLTGASGYEQQGSPENGSPYAGTPARLARARPATSQPAVAKPAAAQPAAAKPAAAKPAASPKPRAKPQARRTAKAKTPARRAPAFAVKGAPTEPLDEISLPARAKRLAAWVEAHPKRTRRAVGHWLYQHNWIVTGARFGWSGGAAALRTLAAVDRRVQALWGVGNRSEKVARRALAEVGARSR